MADDFLQKVLAVSLGSDAKLTKSVFVSGGCINNTLKLDTSDTSFFLKWKAHEPDLFEKEKLGLELLRSNSPLQIPEVLYCGEIEDKNFLLLEWIEKTTTSSDFWENFGYGLAQQHQATANFFGLNHDNHIGRLPQENSKKEDWVTFFIENRIDPQLRLAVSKRLAPEGLRTQFEKLYPELPNLFPNEPPSLLHGDLWSGNFMIGSEGKACIFDPAVYYGHREMELAFTRMFGGFDTQFYEAYSDAWALEPGFENRVDIYNLYPLLVHLNLFGSSYLSPIQQTLARFQ
jgi:protein-ribulosamine 3-kinase